MPEKSKAAMTPSRRVRYCRRGATNPVATSASATPRSSSMSRVDGWKVEARDSRLKAGEPSNTVIGMPRRTRAAAATRPTGPAPATKTRSSVIIDGSACPQPGGSANRPTFKAKTRPPTTAILDADDGLDGRAAMRAIRRIVAALLLLSTAGHAAAQTSYPDQAVRILVGFTPGVAPDIVARVLADKFSESWGRPVLVENVTGAAGNIAADRVAKAAPDGYTLGLLSQVQLVINPSLYKLAYDSVKDFAPVSQVYMSTSILVVHNAVPAKSVKELVALAKAQPGGLTFASGGSGSPLHMAAELFKSMAGVDIRHIPYKGGVAAIPDLLGGRVTMMFSQMSVALPLVREGKLRALAVTSLRRAPAFPELPTIAESGYPGFESTS